MKKSTIVAALAAILTVTAMAPAMAETTAERKTRMTLESCKAIYASDAEVAGCMIAAGEMSPLTPPTK